MGINPFVNVNVNAYQYSGMEEVSWVFYFILGFYLLAFVFYVVMYVLTALGMYRMAKRRGIAYPWLAWIPVASYWILGSISDQYQALVKNKTTNRRGILLGLYIATFILLFIYLISSFVFLFTQNFLFLGVFLLTVFAMLGVSIPLVVFSYIAYFDYYRSADPDNAVLFLVLSIVISAVAPILTFICGKKDGGMPVAEETIPQEQPGEEIPQELPPAQETVPQDQPEEEPQADAEPQPEEEPQQ